MKAYKQPQTKEILLHFQGVMAMSNHNEEGEGEYSRKKDTKRRYGFGAPLWTE